MKAFPIRYEITKGVFREDGCSHTTYGIAAYDTASPRTAMPVMAIHDITQDKERLSDLVERCNRLELSPIHLFDVVEDFLLE